MVTREACGIPRAVTADVTRRQSGLPIRFYGVTPVERRTQRLVAGRRGPAAASEQVKTIVQVLEDLWQGERRNEYRRQFERQRETFDARPQTAAASGALHVVVHAGADDAETATDFVITEALRSQAQDLADVAHGYSLLGHRDPPC